MKRWWYLAALATACTTATARVRPPIGGDEPPPDQMTAPDAGADASAVKDAEREVDAGIDAAGFAKIVDAAAEPAGPDGGALDAPATDDAGSDAAVPDGGLWNGQLVVAVGYDGQRMVSLNGKEWMGAIRDTTGNREGPKTLRAVAYANRQVVAVGGGCDPACAGRILTFDGAVWTEVAVPAGVGPLTGVTYGNGVWVAVGSAPPAVRSTDNGRSWSLAAAAATPPNLRAVAFGEVGKTAMFVAVGDGYSRVTSLDGQSWSHLQFGDGSTDGYRSVAIGNGVVVAAGGSSNAGLSVAGRHVRSVDGITWTDELAAGPELPNVVFADGQFMAFSASGDDTLYLSPDGKDWKVVTTVGAGSNVATGKLLTQRLFLSRISPATIKISVDGYVWGPTAAMSMPGDAVLTAFVIAGEP